jgi:hypothetical protein
MLSRRLVKPGQQRNFKTVAKTIVVALLMKNYRIGRICFSAFK